VIGQMIGGIEGGSSLAQEPCPAAGGGGLNLLYAGPYPGGAAPASK